MVNEPDRVELGLSCANVCRALYPGLNGKKADELNQSVYGAMNRLTAWVKPATNISNRPLMYSRLQDCSRYSDEISQVG